MWTAVIFVCGINASDGCVQTGPQVVFPTENICNEWVIQNLDGLKDYKVQCKCLNWDEQS